MSDYICILKDDCKVTRVSDQDTRSWKHVRILINCNLHVEVWTVDGEFRCESSAIEKMDLNPAKGSKRIITKSGARYYW